MKILIRRDAVEKLVSRLKSVFAEHSIAPTERDSTMIRWFEELLSDDLTPVDRVLKQLGTLKPGWERPLSCGEMQEMHGSMDALSTFTESEWASIREWLSYKPKSYEKLYQVQNRQSFLRSPVDTLTAAETWRDANKALEPRRKAVSEPVGETMTKDEALAILRGIKIDS